MKGSAIVNESSHPELVFDLLYVMASELAWQQAEIADWWQRTTLPVSAASSIAAVPKDPEIMVARFIDQLEDSSALAYHYVDAHGRPCVDIGVNIILSNGGSLTGPESLLTAVSHELNEALIDPYCTFEVRIPNTRLYTPIEVSDWTQGDSYERQQGSGLYLSNFVGPRAFNAAGTDGPWDRMGLMTGPFQLRPGGYWSTYDPTTDQWDTRFGEKMPEWKRAAKLKPGTRTIRRRGR